jgi:antirestriction protein
MEDIRIYVASLSDYNNGRLEGKHFELSDYSDASELMEAIQEMLDELTEKYKSVDGEVREEWAVHDYEGIPSTMASEYMGEQDFQKIYDIAEIADESGLPLEVLMERAGDTGSDDYKALAESLMLVVDGSDESDIVAEYEEQLGELGNDFWSNHIYIDDVTERVIYGEDVDNYRADILSENPDMDEDEAERKAEEMADEDAKSREDLTTYLEDRGYGDTIPSFVSKDYEGAWKRSLSYDFDVINHDDQMYVFSNNYSVGGTILSGMIGAYIGYKVGRAKPQKKGFSTEKKIGRNIKGAVSKKKFAGGGFVSKGEKVWNNMRGSEKYYFLNKNFTPQITPRDQETLSNKSFRFLPKNVKIAFEAEYANKEVYSDGGGVGMYDAHKANIKYLESISEMEKMKILKNIANHYGISVSEAEEEVTYDYAEYLYEYIANDPALRMKVYQEMQVNKMARGGTFNQSWQQDHKRFNKSESYEIPMSKRKRKYANGGVVGQEIVIDNQGEEVEGVIVDIHNSGDYIVRLDDGRSVLAQRDRDIISFGNMAETPMMEAPRKRFGFFEGGGGVNGEMKYYVAMADIRYFDSEGEYKKYNTYNHIKAESEEQAKMIILRFIENALGNNEWEWEDEDIYIAPAQYSDEEIEFRGYLSADKFGGLTRDKFSKGRFADGGGIGFKGLSSKVAKRYEGKKVAPKYQGEYGKRYSKSEASEVGDKVAGKVYREQMARKMENGGGVSGLNDLIRG